MKITEQIESFLKKCGDSHAGVAAETLPQGTPQQEHYISKAILKKIKKIIGTTKDILYVHHPAG
jgi:hypothetical protein